MTVLNEKNFVMFTAPPPPLPPSKITGSPLSKELSQKRLRDWLSSSDNLSPLKCKEDVIEYRSLRIVINVRSNLIHLFRRIFLYLLWKVDILSKPDSSQQPPFSFVSAE